VDSPDDRAPSFYGKLGVDHNVSEEVRLRLTGSAYTTAKSLNNTLHSGDRAGSRYYSVMGEGDWSGRIRSGFSDGVTAFMLNPFVEVKGLELFGLIETVSGTRSGGLDDGTLNQYAIEGIYRFANDDLFVGARYNTMSGDLDISGFGQPANWVDVTVDRWQIGGGGVINNSLDGEPDAGWASSLIPRLFLWVGLAPDSASRRRRRELCTGSPLDGGSPATGASGRVAGRPSASAETERRSPRDPRPSRPASRAGKNRASTDAIPAVAPP